MQTDRLAQRLMSTFLGELEDHLRTLERELLALEREPKAEQRGARFAVLFRTAHSLKGAARSVGIEALETAGHKLEELFACARDGRLAVDAAWFGRVLPIVDDIRNAGARLRAGLVADNDAAGAARSTAPSVVPAIEEAAPPVKPAAAEPPSVSTGWSGVVRIAAGKLDSLLVQSGELLVMHHRALARAGAANALCEAAQGWQKDQQRIEQRLADLFKTNPASDADAQTGTDRVSLWRQAHEILSQHKTGMARLGRDMQRLAADLNHDQRALEQTVQWIDSDVRRLRMLPFVEACEGLDRMVRDLASGGDKKVALAIEGGNIEIDRAVLDGLRDPIVHLLRNAIDHGIEPATVRSAAGKPETGCITLAAAIRGGGVEVIVKDDGRGLDLGAIRDQLRQRGLGVSDDETNLVEHIFSGGFSTAPKVTTVSGRGVGLEVVKTSMQSLRGTVAVTFEPGRGTCFTLRAPLTLTAVRALSVEAGGRTFAIETTGVDRILRIGADDVESIEGREAVMLDGRPAGVVTLAELLGVPERPASTIAERRPAVVLADGARRAAVVVDDIRAERDIVIRPLGRRLRRIRFVTGASLLPDGNVALILSCADIVDGVRTLSSPASVAQSMTVAQEAQSRRLLLVDDSVTTRTLEKSILEGAGYEVMVATDGVEAWQMLIERGADLVVSDVEMPRMDGFALTETIRRSNQFRELPVILMTARDNEADRAQGLKVGANAYLFKSAFDQRELLATIGQIL